MLSIVTVTFNNLAGLSKTTASIISQNSCGFEWIVIDGGSQDGTVEFLKNCDRINYFVSEHDEGIYHAMQKGLNVAKGEYLIFLNAGDTFYGDGAVKYAMQLLSGADVYFFSCRMSGLGVSYLRTPRPLESASYSVPAVQQATVYKLSILRKIAWPTNFQVCGDFAIAAELLVLGVNAVCDDGILSDFELGGVSTNRPFLLAIEAYIIQSRVLHISFSTKALHFLRRLVIGYFVFITYHVRILLKKLV